MSPRAKSWFLENWPVLAAVASGLVAWGSLQARVAAVEDGAHVTKSDHDVLVKVSTQQDLMQKQLDRIEGKVGGQPGGIR